MLEILQSLADHAQRFGGTAAVQELCGKPSQGRTLTYEQLSSSVALTAEAIDSVLPRRCVVIVSLPNSIECTIAFLAVIQSNRAAFLINPSTSLVELERAARTSGAVAIFAHRRESNLPSLGNLRRMHVSVAGGGPARPVLEPNPGSRSAALLLLSSGTTEQPKIVYRDGPSLDAVARNCAVAIGMNRDDRSLVVIPLCHSYGVEHGILAPLYAGSTVLLSRGISADLVLSALRSGNITVLPGVPSMYEMLAELHGASRFGAVRAAFSAGAPLPRPVFERCKDALDLRIGQLYGSSEVGSVTFNDPARPDLDPASVGRPMAGVEVRIVDPTSRDLSRPLPYGQDGEVAIRSPSMLRHYVGQDGAPLREGFFFTEDLGRLDEKGDLTITGRIKLLIDVGAMKVNPLEVERVLQEHPAVDECLVGGLPVSATVHRVRALVVRSNGAAVDAAELRAFARERLSPHKLPRVIEFVDALPRSPNGKLIRRTPAE